MEPGTGRAVPGRGRRLSTLRRPDVPVLVAVSLGGAAGAAARYAVTIRAVAVDDDAVAAATLAVNALGCALIGVLTVLAIDRWPDVRLLRPALGTGVLGGFTTFSAYALDVESLARQGRLAVAAAYLVATPVLAMAAVWAGTAHHPAPGRGAAEGSESTMRLHGSAQRLTIMLGESDQWHHRPLFTEIVHRAHRAGLAGATVLRGIESFGGGSLVHTTRLLSLTEDLPVVVVIVDSHARIAEFLPQLDQLLVEGLVTLEDVEVIRYVGRDAAAPRPLDAPPDSGAPAGKEGG